MIQVEIWLTELGETVSLWMRRRRGVVINSQAKGLIPDRSLESDESHRRGLIFQVNGQGTQSSFVRSVIIFWFRGSTISQLVREMEVNLLWQMKC